MSIDEIYKLMNINEIRPENIIKVDEKIMNGLILKRDMNISSLESIKLTVKKT